ncbi:MAG: HEAT repeat domain-containing protein [Bryobacterales bacterium]|nr:HEAT repeat domain-containing protein [Bryobacterales bacterium]
MRMGLSALISLAAWAQPPVANAVMETRAAGPLETEIAKVQGPAWLGYEAPLARKDNGMRCWGGAWRGWELEKSRPAQAVYPGPVKLEETGQMAVLIRVTGGKAEKVRAFPMECALDAGGLPFVWLTGITPAASAAWLKGQGVDALPALAMQAGAEADDALIRMAKEETSGRTRGQALFWLSQKASAKAMGALGEAVDNDPDTEVKKKAVFALSQLPADDGIPKLIDLAKHNRNRTVREQAMFWLGQSRDPRALRFLEEVLLR